jgi:hypothetical protein
MVQACHFIYHGGPTPQIHFSLSLQVFSTVLHLYQPFVLLNKADPLEWCQVEKGGAHPTTALFQTTMWTWN